MKKDIIKNLETAAEAPANPFDLFGLWFNEATQSEPVDPNAMSLATVDASGRPSVRIVLLKAWDSRGFVFYTNMTSRKGGELLHTPHAAMCFHWKSLSRQVRVEGRFEPVTDAEADAYYATRPRGSRIGAWASLQSQPLESRTALADRVRTFEEKFTDATPRPPHWTGCRIVPERIEFWHDGTHRLHTRVLYAKAGEDWTRQMLYP